MIKMTPMPEGTLMPTSTTSSSFGTSIEKKKPFVINGGRLGFERSGRYCASPTRHVPEPAGRLPFSRNKKEEGYDRYMQEIREALGIINVEGETNGTDQGLSVEGSL